ncbi:disease resistance protein RPM1-like [Andrographis paniculata]|uniref:disease resistance protein RPM1-like n=1 Tax=Andrographis paniculata TaxID=175694 RepID=UPI0021E734E1|nr:disease resistance protein RPM1-like [Andrographis paniculata]
MAESAVAFLLNNLTIWLQENQNLLGGLKVEAKIIQGELQQMQAFLKAADSREDSDPQIKAWVRQVREIAHDIEDVLEAYMLSFRQNSSPGIRGRFKKYYFCIKDLKAKRRMASEIRNLRSRTESASKTFRQLYAVLPTSNPDTVSISTYYDGRDDALLLEETDVVGIEKPKKKLLEWISIGDSTLTVLSVTGMAGLGKTTLVKKVFDDSSVEQNIDHHVWIAISQVFNQSNILRDLIKQLLEEVKQPLPRGFEDMNVAAMKEFIYSFLQHKRYIVVLDDVWSTNVWESLRYVFPRRNTCGRGCVIITSRLNSIGDAASCESGGHVYPLQPLPPQRAEELFRMKAFRGGPCPYHLKEVSGNILKKCGGLPLAIVVIGSALAMKRNQIEEWRRFSFNLESKVDDCDLMRIWKLLALSYYDLPYYLKACLLYLSIFPEDALLEKATLIRLWIVEGFVEAEKGKTMEETAESYLNELSNRSLIQVATTKDGRPRNFRIHDVVREYIISKAREQNIVAAILKPTEITLEDQVRRLALEDSSAPYSDKINNLRYLRTLLFFGSMELEWGPIICRLLRGECRMLKVLDLRGAPLEEIPCEVFKLYHLKYLSLKNTNVSIIPKLIGNLAKLEILDLKGSNVTELPIEILKLRRLRYLLVYRYKDFLDYLPFDHVQSFKAPYGIGQLSRLQKLCYIDASAEVVRGIGRLTELQRLGITRLRKEDGKELSSSLSKLTFLTSLSIAAGEEGEVIDLPYFMPSTCLRFLRLEGCLEKLPEWISSLDALTSLHLRSSKLRDDPIECLQSLANLKDLVLYGAYEGEGLHFKSGGFKKLEELQLIRMRRLKWVRVEKGCMTNLREFEIWDCKEMKDVPIGIEHLGNLDFVDFSDMSNEFEDRVCEEKGRGRVDVHAHDHDRERKGKGKLIHIPNVRISNWVDGQWEAVWL